MAKILVTGATGFIGNHIVNELLKKGHQVVASSSNQKRASSFSWYSRVNYIPFDLNDFDSTINYWHYFGEPDAMLHLSWEGLPNYLQDFHMTINLPRHKQLLENMIEKGLKNITVSGTCFEYGMQSGCLNESMDCHPANPYAQAKNELRKFLEKICVNHQCSFKWVRLFYMYGSGQNPKSLIAQLEKAIEQQETSFNMSGGEQIRDFLPISVVARYLVAIGLQTKVDGIINCCSGQPVAVKDFVKQYLHAQHRSIELNLGYYPYPEYEPMEFWGDVNKLNSIINIS